MSWKTRARNNQAAEDEASGHAYQDKLCICGHERGIHDQPDFGVVQGCSRTGCLCKQFQYAYVLGMKSKFATYNVNGIYQGDNCVLQIFGLPIHNTLEDVEKSIRQGTKRLKEPLAFGRELATMLNRSAREKAGIPEPDQGPSHQTEETRRTIKALKLSFILQQAKADPFIEPTEYQWALAAQLAKVNPPSDKTKAMVMRMLRPDVALTKEITSPQQGALPTPKKIATKKRRSKK